LQYQIKGKSIAIGRKVNPSFELLGEDKGTIQHYVVKGRVTNKEGQALAGVTVLVKGETIGTNTDQNGEYTIEINDAKNGILVFRSVGYVPKEIAVQNQVEVSVVLETLLSDLDEVVVVGYGVQKKSVITAAISRISSED